MLVKRILHIAARPVGWRAVAGVGLLCVVVFTIAWTGFFGSANYPGDRGYVGPDHFKTVGDREFLLASDSHRDSQWFDITASPLDKDGYQFGIGKDTIPSIDDPVFVDPDDPRLLKLARLAIDSTDALRVIGYADGDEARAYPIGLLDAHELVNDTMAGKPITVGW